MKLRLNLFLMIFVSASFITACLPESKSVINDSAPIRDSFNWNIPAHLPLPLDNIDNPASEEKFQLGRHLFYDQNLSGNGTQSCADCHKQELAFSDGLATSEGSTGDILARNSQSLVNTSYNISYTWANISLVRLERQALIPLFGEDPIEQGINDENREEVLANIASEEIYQDLFINVYGNADKDLNYENIVNAIAVFVRGINSFSSPYDQYLEGDPNAISDSAKRGEQLFFGERFECFHCHGGFNFTDATLDQSQSFPEKLFHNTGLYNIDGIGSYPEENIGLKSQTNLQSDMGKFKAPSLRNIALTAPYTHDGSVATLEEMLNIYAAGGRVIESGENAGDGRNNPFKDGLITGFSATQEEINDVISFLNSLSDENLQTNPRFASPWN